MKKIITLLMCLVCCCSYAFIYEGNGGQWLSEDIAVGSGGIPSFNPNEPYAFVSIYLAGTTTKITSDYQVNIGNRFDLTSLPINRIGYDFVNFTDSDNNIITSVTPMVEDEEIAVYTNWNIRHWNITWELTDNSKTPAATYRSVVSNVEYNSVITASDTPYIPEGYTFSGWDNPTYMPDKNLVVRGEIIIGIYGFTIAEIDSTSPTAPYPVTYLRGTAAFNKTPLTVTDGVIDEGSWTNWINEHFTPIMLKGDGTEDYELSRSNHNLRSDGVTPSDINNPNYDGNAMVKIKKFYTSYSKEDNVITVKISDSKIDDSFHCNGFIDANGVEQPYVYYSMFYMSVFDGTPKSLVAAAPSSNPFTNTKAMVDSVKAFYPTGFNIKNYAIWDSLRSAAILVTKKICIGTLGFCESDDVIYTPSARTARGNFLTSGAFALYNSTAYTSKFFYIENFFGNGGTYEYEPFVGLYVKAGVMQYKDREPYPSPSTSFTVDSSYTPLYSPPSDMHNGAYLTQLVVAGNVLTAGNSRMAQTGFYAANKDNGYGAPQDGYYQSANYTYMCSPFNYHQDASRTGRIFGTPSHSGTGINVISHMVYTPQSPSLMMSAPRGRSNFGYEPESESEPEPEYEEPIIATESEEIQ